MKEFSFCFFLPFYLYIPINRISPHSSNSPVSTSFIFCQLPIRSSETFSFSHIIKTHFICHNYITPSPLIKKGNIKYKLTKNTNCNTSINTIDTQKTFFVAAFLTVFKKFVHRITINKKKTIPAIIKIGANAAPNSFEHI